MVNMSKGGDCGRCRNTNIPGLVLAYERKEKDGKKYVNGVPTLLRCGCQKWGLPEWARNKKLFDEEDYSLSPFVGMREM
jgi:hypothetical protein